jgi:hypothetical protein
MNRKCLNQLNQKFIPKYKKSTNLCVRFQFSIAAVLYNRILFTTPVTDTGSIDPVVPSGKIKKQRFINQSFTFKRESQYPRLRQIGKP